MPRLFISVTNPFLRLGMLGLPRLPCFARHHHSLRYILSSAQNLPSTSSCRIEGPNDVPRMTLIKHRASVCYIRGKSVPATRNAVSFTSYRACSSPSHLTFYPFLRAEYHLKHHCVGSTKKDIEALNHPARRRIVNKTHPDIDYSYRT